MFLALTTVDIVMMSGAIGGLCVTGLSLLYKMTTGFTIIQQGQMELKKDFEGLSTKFDDQSKSVTEVEKDIIHLHAVTGSLPRTGLTT